MAEDEQGVEGQAAARPRPATAPVRAVDGEFTPPLATPANAEPPSKPASGATCPSCGVAVAPGYPKCPKCHAALPVLPSPLTRATTTRPARVGGTSVAGERPQGWLLGLLGAVVALGIVLYLASSGDEGPGLAPRTGNGGGAEVAGSEAAIAGAGLGNEGEGDEAETFSDDEPAGGDPEILVELRAQLQVAKLWSTVFVDPADGEAIVVESNQCEDAQMAALIDRMTKTLDEAGFARATCLSKFGATVFENEWRKPAGEANDTAGASGVD